MKFTGNNAKEAGGAIMIEDGNLEILIRYLIKISLVAWDQISMHQSLFSLMKA